MTKETLPRLYARLLARHGYGHAFYEPISASELSPGCCGYLNTEGAWNPILRLDQQDILQKHGLTVTALEHAPRSTREWGPKTSTNVKQTKIDLKGDAPLIPAGIPADIGALFQYETLHEEGTILLTSPPVAKCSLRHEAPIKQWVRDNARVLARAWPDVLEHGLFVVTSTHSTIEARLNILNSNSKTVSVGFHAGLVQVGEIAPSTTWHTSWADSGWIKVVAEKAGDEKVVFMGGLYFRWPFGTIAPGHTKGVRPEKWQTRFRSDEGDELTLSIPESNDNNEGACGRESFDIAISPIGTDEHRLAEKEMVVREEEETDAF